MFVTRRCTSTVIPRRLQKSNLHSQGSGVYGALGQGDDLQDSPSFRPVPLITNDDKTMIKAKMVSAGWGHSAVVTMDDKVHVFGRPYDFSTLMQINRLKSVSSGFARFVGRFTSRFGSPADGLYSTPQQIDNLAPVSSVHCAAGLTAMLTKEGELYAFGQNRWGQCGVGDTKQVHIYEPTKMRFPVAISSIDVGLQHGVAVSKKGNEVYTWGKGNRGQLGLPDGDTFVSPQKVPKLKGITLAVSAGFNHTAVLMNEGEVFVWGKGMSDILKSDTTRGLFPLRIYEDQMTPRRITIPNHRIIEICSSNFTLVLRCDDGSLWAMGMGEYDRSTSPFPLRVQQANLQASEGSSSSVATTTDTTTNMDIDPPVILSSTAKLCKGFQRVAIVTDTPNVLDTPGLTVSTSTISESSSPSTSSNALGNNPLTVYEVVIHAGEAFLKIKTLDIITNGPNTKIIDYSTGWQHNLLIVE